MKITQTKDYEMIAKLNKGVQDVHVNLYPDYFKPYEYEPVREFFKDVSADPDSIFLLVEVNEGPIGYAWVKIRNSPETFFKKATKSIYVHQISVNEESRSLGIGAKLIERIEELAKLNGATTIELDYWLDNIGARNFYEKQGFIKSREFVYKEVN